MSTRFWSFAASAFMLAAMPCGVANAALEAGDDIVLFSNKPGTQGPFSAYIIDDAANPGIGTASADANTVAEASALAELSFLTFCVQPDETFYTKRVYNLQSTDGTISVDGPDRWMSGYAAFAFAAFSKLELDVNSTSTDFQNAVDSVTGGGVTADQAMNAFQNSIWAGMLDISVIAEGTAVSTDIGGANSGLAVTTTLSVGGTGGIFTAGSTYDKLGIGWDDFVASGWDLNSNSFEAGGQQFTVSVMVLTDANGNHAQDQSYLMIEDKVNQEGDIPEPGSFAIMLGLVCCAAGYRRWRNTA